MIKKIYNWSVNTAWILMVVTLPVTSFPFIAEIFGGTSVAPLPVIFLAFLTIGWYLPILIKKRSLPSHSIPLLIFVLFALISTLAGEFLLTPTFRTVSPWRNSLEAVITLAMGVCFYLIIQQYLCSNERLIKFVKLINYSGFVMVLYALFQAVVFYLLKRYPEGLRIFQSLFSSSMLFMRRSTGFAYEPSWYAHLLNLVYLPLWLGFSLKKTSVHKLKLWKISFENILLVLGVISLFLSFSRIGWLSFILVIGYLLLTAMHRWSKKIIMEIEHKRNKTISSPQKVLIKTAFWLVSISVMVGLLLIAGKVLTILDPRMADLFDLSVIKEKGLLEWAGGLIFAERLIYWNAGYRVFLTYPIIGVGLGRSGYFFQYTFDAFGYKLLEIISVLLRQGFIPNAKNLWVRILAETGLVGFSIFSAFLYIHWKSAREVERQGAGLIKALGLSGQFFLIALLVEGFSIDSFGLPFLWTSLAVIVASYRVLIKNENTQDEDKSG